MGNLLYVGSIAHKGESYDGQHPAIIDAGTWDTVQALLAGHAPARSSASRATDPSPLTGKLFDEAGRPLTPSHAVKSGRRYRYYVSKHLIAGTVCEGNERDGWRLPARGIERVVSDGVESLFSDRAALADTVRGSGVSAEQLSGLLDALLRWQGEHFELVERVDLDTDGIAAVLDLSSLFGQAVTTIRHVLPARMKRRGVEMRLVLNGAGSETAKTDSVLIKAVARAHSWLDDLLSGRADTIAEIARAEGLGDRYVSRLLPLALLAPDIVEKILAGTQPVDVTVEMLTKQTTVPLNWTEQRVLLQFD